MLCDYGCGQKSNYDLKNGKKCCSTNRQSCPEIKKKNSEGLKKSYLNGSRLSGAGSYQLLSEKSKTLMAHNRGKQIISNEFIFVENSKYDNDTVKKRILQNLLMEYKCADCGLTEWQGKSIVLELEHCNGVRNDHRLENLKFLCPNCHSQTETFRGRNKNTGKIIVTDEELLTALANSANVRQALQKVGLAAKGGNYARVKSLKAKMNI